MPESIQLQADTRQLLLKALDLPDDLSDRPGISSPARCPALWVLPELLALLEEFRDHQAHELKPVVYRLIVEQNFVDDCGDKVFDSESREEVEQQLELILDVLEKVRLQAIQQGVWSDVPATHPWCG